MADLTYDTPRTVIDETDDIDRTEVRSFWSLVRTRFLRHRLAVFGATVLAILVVLSLDASPPHDAR